MTWEIRQHEGTYLVYDDESCYVMSCLDKQRAQLIANTPKMLETLCSIRDQVECFMQPLPDGVARARWAAVRKRAVAAIAAVKGEETK